ncbi:MAG: RNA polymerase factor sigma-54 [Candidatus Sumerlaeia bacterium]
MALNLQQLQKQTQRLIMTPQMQQSIQLLQLTSLELEQMAEQELLENPFLSLEEEEPSAEAGEPADERTPATDAEAAEAPADEAETQAGETGFDLNETASGGESVPDEPVAEPPAIDAAPEHFDDVDLNWDDYYSDAENPTYTGGTNEETEERDFTEYTAARASLYDSLDWQLRCSSLEGIDAEIGEYLIGSLNEDGYIEPAVLTEAAEKFQVPVEQVERVLSIVQELDPPGIAARTLSECLLNQMKQLGSYSELARDVLENHMIAFQKKKFRELARTLNVDEEKLHDLFNKVCRLEPHPGRSLTKDSAQYIQPDVFVKLIDGEMMIYLNEGLTRRLSVDRYYRRLLRQHSQAMSGAEREYAMEKYRAALTLIKNIEKRKSTILRVTEAIMEVQRPFLDRGVEVLKPLTLREVADMVGMHESTVARVTSRKYVETPQGTYPLKFFFSSSIESEGAEAVSSRVIKDKLQSIISAEDARKPLSDQKIVEMLQKDGYDIARRTVAKYREQLKILPAKYRRQT